jgi:hypothetical protein
MAGLTLYGAGALARRPLSRFNGAALLAGVPMLVWFVASQAYELITGSWFDLGTVASAAFLLTTGLGLVLLGLAFRHSAAPQVQPA